MVFHNVVLLRIIEKSDNLKFEMEVQSRQWMEKVPWYYTTICSQLNGHIFEAFSTGRKDRYEFMCDVDAYKQIMHQRMMMQIVAVIDQLQVRHLK